MKIVYMCAFINIFLKKHRFWLILFATLTITCTSKCQIRASNFKLKFAIEAHNFKHVTSHEITPDIDGTVISIKPLNVHCGFIK